MPLYIPRQFLSSSRLVRQLLDEPNLMTTVQALPSESLLRLVNHVGLEDAGEFLSLATSQQILEVFDMDIWRRSHGGEDDAFDPKRFLLWLEILLEGGEGALVSRLVDLPEALLFLAFHTHLIVLNLDDLAEQMAQRTSQHALDEKALESCLGHELDEFYLVARQHDGWDALLTTILALYDREPDLLTRILSRCCHASWEIIEENGGLYNVLTAPEMLEADAAADRADRRAGQGFVAPSDARAFLSLARITPTDDILDASEPDPVTRTYFREWRKPETNAAPGSPDAPPPPPGKPSPPPDRRLLSMLEASGVLEESRPALAESADGPEKSGRFQTRLSRLAGSDPEEHESRVQEVVFLANVIDAGLGSSENPIRTADALQAVYAVCDIGLSVLDHRPSSDGLDDASPSHRHDISPIGLFKIGWRDLFEKSAPREFDDLQRAIAGPPRA